VRVCVRACMGVCPKSIGQPRNSSQTRKGVELIVVSKFGLTDLSYSLSSSVFEDLDIWRQRSKSIPSIGKLKSNTVSGHLF